MDNVTHTLIGAALAQTGLKRRTGMGAATLMIGANFPDIDVIAVPLGYGTAFRRGVTHGVLALIVLPFVLTALMMAWDRYKRRRTREERTPLKPSQLLLLAAVSILTHPTFDWLNSYGMRWLMPFDGQWFYGDSIFIIDPWLLLMLGAGVWLSRRKEKRADDGWTKPARFATGVAAAYVLAMLALERTAERLALQVLRPTGRAAHALHVMASPANPLKWTVYADDGNRIRRGAVRLLASPEHQVQLGSSAIPKNAHLARVFAASEDASVRPFVDWARIPYYQIVQSADRTFVRIVDARYGASMEVPVPGS